MKTEIQTPGQVFKEKIEINPNFEFHDEISSGTFWINVRGDLIMQRLVGSEWKEALRAKGLMKIMLHSTPPDANPSA